MLNPHHCTTVSPSSFATRLRGSHVPTTAFTGLIQHDPSKDGVIRHGHSLKLNAWANRELQMKLCLLADGLGVTSLLRNVALQTWAKPGNEARSESTVVL